MQKTQTLLFRNLKTEQFPDLYPYTSPQHLALCTKAMHIPLTVWNSSGVDLLFDVTNLVNPMSGNHSITFLKVETFLLKRMGRPGNLLPPLPTPQCPCILTWLLAWFSLILGFNWHN